MFEICCVVFAVLILLLMALLIAAVTDLGERNKQQVYQGFNDLFAEDKKILSQLSALSDQRIGRLEAQIEELHHQHMRELQILREAIVDVEAKQKQTINELSTLCLIMIDNGEQMIEMVRAKQKKAPMTNEERSEWRRRYAIARAQKDAEAIIEDALDSCANEIVGQT